MLYWQRVPKVRQHDIVPVGTKCHRCRGKLKVNCLTSLQREAILEEKEQRFRQLAMESLKPMPGLLELVKEKLVPFLRVIRAMVRSS
jgi:hypothetical protein